MLAIDGTPPELLNWLGYASALLVYLLILGLTQFTPGRSVVKRVLTLTLLCGAIWAAIHLSGSWLVVFDTPVFIGESLRLVSVIGLLLVVSQGDGKIGSGHKMSAILALSTGMFLPLANEIYWLSKNAVFTGYLALTLLALFYIETLLRQAKNRLWGLKPLLIGLGTLLVYDFIVFADASLLKQVEPTMWLARGYLHTLFIPFLFWSMKRSRQLGGQIYISRDVVWRSSLLLGAGLYLTVMALTGYYIRSIEGQWSSMLQILFTALAFVVLLFVLLSSQFKRKARVLIQKHFFANRFDYRARWLALTHLLSQPFTKGEDAYQRALKGVLDAMELPIGALVKQQGATLSTVADIGFWVTDSQLAAIKQGLCPFLKDNHWIVDGHEYRLHPEHYPKLALSGWQEQQLASLVVIPIYNPQGLWGMVLLKSSKEMRLDWEMRDYVGVVTEQVSHYLTQYETRQQLLENAQFVAFSRTSAFVVHDLKNVLAQIRLILSNATKHKHNPEFIEDTFETLSHTDTRLQKMLTQLTSRRADSHEVSRVAIAECIQNKVLPRCRGQQPQPELKVERDFSVQADSETLATVLYHLVDNAQQATPDKGAIRIFVTQREQQGQLTIVDTGNGMTEEFIQTQLFTPFVTTKGNAGMGIGAYEAKHYMESLGGQVAVTSSPGEGTRFDIRLPILTQE
ncbi:hypothetical protein HMF8227_01192 [Saliniradius amylolyticus]|uniref:histidine kinase n=1 Tax=Saliniradius amylolyticus TaxID=2183582 RepID=A0A2S2E204_9ALTE|nr:XrtA/PEP-CTERM system histidine kinase PrsK [Saliniradius amylolyticus]AWL11673.1 hypothetical protein HMF8227_01192 [Saliniradius amylolyticus]